MIYKILVLFNLNIAIVYYVLFVLDLCSGGSIWLCLQYDVCQLSSSLAAILICTVVILLAIINTLILNEALV